MNVACCSRCVSRVESASHAIFGCRAAKKATELLAEFLNSRQALSFYSPSLSARPSTVWVAPPPGSLKPNTEAAVHKNSRSFGIGVAIRDDKGKVLTARLNLLIGSFSSQIGQVLVVREGLLLAKFYHFSVSTFENSSSSVISSLSNSVNFRGDASFIVADIKTLISDVGICKCQSSSKQGNLMHRLASIAFSSVHERLWLDSSPSLVVICFFSFKKRKRNASIAFV
ncbi:hypothetical protein Ddye_030409 [Dipteronia dyeriana]|uniref:RNase H type-1 domain-containing protein n=1 Tax=Dipteronia dyeriana TaxID=168575 RepID=A0AAD9TGG3_9ROSI|nr:hypothetical protein Ddye_030409 [Dipteronia dyeriana]